MMAPKHMIVLTRREHVYTLAIAREVSPLVAQRRSTNSDRPLRSGRRIVTGVSVVVPGGDVVLGDSLSPGGPTLELDVVDVDTGVDDVDVNTLTASRVVLVESERSEPSLLRYEIRARP